MLPEMFRIFSVPVSGYPFFYILGLAVGATAILLLCRREKLDQVETAAFILLGMACGLLGSRLLAPLAIRLSRLPGATFSRETLRRDFASGGSYFGAVLAALPFAFFYARAFFKKNSRRLWDVTAIGIALGHAVGRLGCLAAGCCFGVPTRLPWGVSFKLLGHAPHPLAGIPLHPVQLYESALGFVNFIFLYLLWRKRKFPGQVFSFYLINYGLIRFFLEFLRFHETGETLWPGGLSWYQAFSLLLVLAGWLCRARFRQKRADDPSY
jgi:phosphatidylglycerol---prolipoprotein diacylglyceryl transferase